jgi:DnaK suppressor protein
MQPDEIARLLDAAAEEYRREAAELAELAQQGEPQSDATGETDWFGQHPADAASDTVEREIDFGLQLDTRAVLAEIIAASRRLADGTYGHCETCGRPIDEDRLRAVPWARRCVADERAMERSSMHLLPSNGRRVGPFEDAPAATDSIFDPENDHPVAPAEEAAVNAQM